MADTFQGVPSPQPMSQAAFAVWGLSQVAYVKRIDLAGTAGWAIHAADGSHMGLAPTRDVALAAIRQHELEPLSVH